MGTLATQIKVKAGEGHIRLDMAYGYLHTDGDFQERTGRYWGFRNPAQVTRLGEDLKRAVAMHVQAVNPEGILSLSRLDTWQPEGYEVALLRPRTAPDRVGGKPFPHELYLCIAEHDFDPACSHGQSRKAIGVWLSGTESLTLSELLLRAAQGPSGEQTLMLDRGMDPSYVVDWGPDGELAGFCNFYGRRVLLSPEDPFHPANHAAPEPWEAD